MPPASPGRPLSSASRTSPQTTSPIAPPRLPQTPASPRTGNEARHRHGSPSRSRSPLSRLSARPATASPPSPSAPRSTQTAPPLPSWYPMKRLPTTCPRPPQSGSSAPCTQWPRWLQSALTRAQHQRCNPHRQPQAPQLSPSQSHSCPLTSDPGLALLPTCSPESCTQSGLPDPPYDPLDQRCWSPSLSQTRARARGPCRPP